MLDWTGLKSKTRAGAAVRAAAAKCIRRAPTSLRLQGFHGTERHTTKKDRGCHTESAVMHMMC